MMLMGKSSGPRVFSGILHHGLESRQDRTRRSPAQRKGTSMAFKHLQIAGDDQIRVGSWGKIGARGHPQYNPQEFIGHGSTVVAPGSPGAARGASGSPSDGPSGA